MIVIDPGHWEEVVIKDVDTRPQERTAWIGCTVKCDTLSCARVVILEATDDVYAPIYSGQSRVLCSIFCTSCNLVTLFWVDRSHA